MNKSEREELEKRYIELKKSVGDFSVLVSILSLVSVLFFIVIFIMLFTAYNKTISNKIFLFGWTASYLFCLFSYFIYRFLSKSVSDALGRNEISQAINKYNRLSNYQYFLLIAFINTYLGIIIYGFF